VNEVVAELQANAEARVAYYALAHGATPYAMTQHLSPRQLRVKLNVAAEKRDGLTANGTIRKDPPTVVNPHGDRVRRAGTRKAPPPSGTAWRRRPASVLLAFEAAFCRRVINSDFSKGERLELMSLEPTFWVRSFSRH
jgi:hypothetical protein